MDTQEAFEHWFIGDIEEQLYDVSGGDWSDLVQMAKDSFKAGWDARYATLTTRDL